MTKSAKVSKSTICVKEFDEKCSFAINGVFHHRAVVSSPPGSGFLLAEVIPTRAVVSYPGSGYSYPGSGFTKKWFYHRAVVSPKKWFFTTGQWFFQKRLFPLRAVVFATEQCFVTEQWFCHRAVVWPKISGFWPESVVLARIRFFGLEVVVLA